MTPTEEQLLAALIEMREACCAAMRVIADIDIAKLLNLEAETCRERFADELQIVGVKNGFGKRADSLIKELRPETQFISPGHERGSTDDRRREGGGVRT